jgi:hypothetical protein
MVLDDEGYNMASESLNNNSKLDKKPVMAGSCTYLMV